MPAPLRLLLVNDDEDGLYLLNCVVKHEFPAAETIACRCGLDALAQLAAQPIDAVVTDNRMPTLTGMELVRAIRAAKLAMPVIMFTSSEEKEREAREAGVSAFISGGNWPEIRRVIREAIATAARAEG